MFYRITDSYGIPYLEGYNTKSIKELAISIYNKDEYWRQDKNVTIQDIEQALKDGEIFFDGYYVEKRKTPFNKWETYLILNQ